jgi:hypothetical protein
MNIEQTLVLIAVLLIFVICIVTIVLLLINFNNYPLTRLEGFLGCMTEKGNMTKLVGNRVRYNNMNNNGRITELKRGPVPNFHQQFTGGLPPELQWRNGIETNMNNLSEVSGINGEMIQEINPVDNVYKSVEY